MLKKQHQPFFISVFGGIAVWLVIFFLFPAKIVYPFSSETFWFIILSYCSLFLGYFIFPYLRKQKVKSAIIISKKFIYLLVLISLSSFVIRYIDLFLFRKVSFANDVWVNRVLLMENEANVIFIVASICIQFYFMPIIFILQEKIKDKKLLIISIVLFLLPFIEGFIRGSRNTFFMSVVLLLFILLYFKKINFTKKNILLILSVSIILFIIATSIIMGREAKKTDENYTSLTTDFFLNDYLKPNPIIFDKIHATDNKTLKKLLVSGLQFEQYYVHGVFEFDNLIKHYKKQPLELQYGKFTFFTINKFTNKFGFSNTDLEAVELKNPRVVTFITFFGGLYLDFGWLGLLIMFLYGSLQRHVTNSIFRGRNSYLPLLIFLLFCNFFMLTFNFLKGMGTNILVVCFVVIFSLSLWNKLRLKVR